MTPLRRGGWAMADQGVSSAANVLLMVLVARQVPAADFGAFALLYGYYVVAVEISRAVCSEPLLVRVPRAARKVLAASSGTALCCALPFAVALPPLAALATGEWTAAPLVLAVALPVLLVQDALRMGFIASGRPRRAFVSDLVWGVSQCGLLLACTAFAVAGLPVLVAAWAAGGAVAAGVAMLAGWVLPNPGAWRSWWTTYGDLSRPYCVETAALATAAYGVLVAVGGVAGLAAAGALRAVQTLFGPVNVILAAGRWAAINELSRAAPDRRTRGALLVSAAFAGVALAAGALVLLLPDAAGHALFGEAWELAAPLAALATAERIFAGAAVGPSSALRAGEAVRELFALRTGTAAMAVTFGTCGAVLAGAPGAAAGLALSAAINCLLAGTLLWVPDYRRKRDYRSKRCTQENAANFGGAR